MKLVNLECYSPKQTKPLFEILVFTILYIIEGQVEEDDF
jgi:hypothetical protein